MKRLLILRHASAVPTAPGGDRERALSETGRAEASAMAAAFAGAGRRPDRALVSPARRTRETWEGLALADVPVEFVGAIYDAEPDALLDIVAAQPDALGTLLLVGHNPGVSDLADLLAGASLPSLVPAELLVLDLTAEGWRGVAPGKGSVAERLLPGAVDRMR